MRSSFARGRWTLLCIASVLASVVFFHDFLITRLGSSYKPGFRQPQSQYDTEESSNDAPFAHGGTTSDIAPSESAKHQATTTSVYARPSTSSAIVAPSGRNHTKTLVIAKTIMEDISWTATELSSEPDLSLAIYTMDDPSPENPIPENKGHEAMAYLTHIIEKYDDLDDVTLFMHAHRITWHNNDLLDSDASKMVQHLSVPHVLRNGYVNMRCHHEPGCPAHLFPHSASDDINIPEAVIMHRAWTDLFPGEQVPKVLAQPCCAQFAVSRDRIHSHPRSRYIEMRKWLLNSDLDDRLSGRVFEYVWQYFWGGVYEFCPKPNICYCESYGICFGDEDEYYKFFDLRDRLREVSHDMGELGDKDGLDEHLLEIHDSLVKEKSSVEEKQKAMKAKAFERGKDPKNRAMEAGRPWSEGHDY